MFLVRLFIISFSLSLSSSIFAQTNNESLLWSWTRVHGNLDSEFIPSQLQNKLLGSLEYHYRLNNKGRDFQSLILRPMIGYKLTDGSTLWVGYAYIEANTNNGLIHENRLFQMITYKRSSLNDALVFVSNSRVEERFFDDSEATAFRFRQMLKVSYNLFKIKKSQVSAFIQNEYFYNINTTESITRGFNQNQFLTGLAFSTHINNYPVNLSVGYMDHLNSASERFQGINVGIIVKVPSRSSRPRRKY